MSLTTTQDVTQQGKLLVGVALFLVGLAMVGCDDDPPQNVPGESSVLQDGGMDQSQHQRDLAPDQRSEMSLEGGIPDLSPDAPVGPGNCECALHQVCTVDKYCITPPSPKDKDSVAHLVLLRQHDALDSTIFGHLGKAEALIFAWEPLPVDTRQTFTTAEGETCWLEYSTEYPYYYDKKTWPNSAGLGLGNLTFKVTGGTSDIILEAHQEGSMGFSYLHDDVPPQLTDGNVTLVDFFDTKYLPSGAPFAIDTAGGPHLPAQLLEGGELPIDFTIDDPPESQETPLTFNTELKVSWSPPQPTAQMDIFITMSVGFSDYVLLSCKVKDDGSTTIPAAAMSSFYGPTGIQLRRNVIRYRQVKSARRTPLHIYLIGRHARLGDLFISQQE